MDIHISLAAEEIFRIYGFPITNSMLTGVVASVVVAVLMIIAARSLQLFPSKGWLHIIDPISEVLLDLIESVIHDRQKAVQFFPVLSTFFLFILANNWLGLLPGVGSITLHGVPLFRGLAADLNATIALGIISIVLMHVYAIKELGVRVHLSKYFSLNPLKLFIGLLELLSDFSKVFSFSFRLFGNIFAGEVLLLVIAYLLPLLGPLPFFFLELFVGFVQALVFTMLTLVFLYIATSHHGEGEAPTPALSGS